MDAPDTIESAPQPQPAITDPQMDTNKVYEQKHERPQQVSDNQPIQLAQNDVPTMPGAPLPRNISDMTPEHLNPETSNVRSVATPDGSKIVFPRGTTSTEAHQHISKWCQDSMEKAAIAVGGAINATPGAGAALEAGQKYYVEPTEKYLGAVGEAAKESVQSPLAKLPPKTQTYLRSQGVNPEGPMPAWAQGINESTIQFASQCC